METNTNKTKHVLDLHPGDNVYMTLERTGPCKKLKPIYRGPYVVETVESAHMICLLDPEGKKSFPRPIHVDRLKPACIRQPSPMNFFKVVSKRSFASQTTQTDPIASGQPENEGHMQSNDTVCDDAQPQGPPETSGEVPMTDFDESDTCLKRVKDCGQSSSDAAVSPSIPTRPKRNIKKPVKLRGSDHVDPDDLELSTGHSSKVTRVLAQRYTSVGIQSLVQIVGEPAQNSQWISKSELTAKTPKSVKLRPPPLVKIYIPPPLV